MGKKGAVGAMTTGDNPGITPAKNVSGRKNIAPKSKAPKPRTKDTRAKTR